MNCTVSDRCGGGVGDLFVVDAVVDHRESGAYAMGMPVLEVHHPVGGSAENCTPRGSPTHPHPRDYRSTAHRSDRSWLFETSGPLIGAEVTSPESRSERRFWDQLRHVCHMINNFEGVASRQAGCHVTVGIEGHEHTIVRHENLLRGIRTYENLLYRARAEHHPPPTAAARPRDQARTRSPSYQVVALSTTRCRVH